VFAKASDCNFIAFNISSQNKFQQNQNVQSLSEVSPIGKIWDKHRTNADKVLHYYAKADEDYFQQYAWRMRICSELLKFQLVPEESEGILKLKLSDVKNTHFPRGVQMESEGILKLKLSDARFCRVRHCPVCQWRQCLRIDYQPVVHTSAMSGDKPLRVYAKHHNPSLLIPEILKYQVKESDLVGDREWFLELTRQLHRSRAIAVGGILRQYRRELEEKNQDLIDENEETDEVDGESLYFRWERKLQRFNIE
jgi:hypothetical protein